MRHLTLTVIALVLSFASYALGPITGPTHVCASGGTITLSNATPGGTWNSSIPAAASVTSAGVVTAGTGGSSTVISYDDGTSVVTATITVDPLPATYSVTGGGAYCSGTGVNIWLNGSQIGINYQLFNGPAAVGAPIAGTALALTFGFLTNTGTYSVSATDPTTGCMTVMTGTASITTGTVPGPITGPTSVCPGSTIMLTSNIAGGTWSSSNVAIATVQTITGAVMGVAAGIADLTYTTGAGCIATMSVTVDPTPAPISGPTAMCDNGTTVQLSCATPGGTWSSSIPTFATISNTGVVAGVATGVTNIDYTIGLCSSVQSFTVNTQPTLSGPTSVCVGSTIVLTSNVAGGTWMTSATSVATVHINTGAVTGVTAGTAPIIYSPASGCLSTKSVTVNASPGPITGPTTVCVGNAITLNSTTPGGSWASYNTVIATINSASGVLTGASPGMVGIVYASGGCNASTTITVTSSLALTAAATQACGGLYTLTGSGGTTYSWSPATGLSCSTCATTTANPAAATTYTLTGTSGTCSGTATTSVSVNQVSGHITYTGSPTDSFRVWLTLYDPTDSSITALDSTVSCMDAGTPWYIFNNPAPGSYMVKAKLFGTVPGTSGYIPTYGLSSATWNTATTVTHGSGADSQHINMILGTVPSGPGFISGNVYYGAGKGTLGEAPAPDMLIYLKNTSSNVLTYTYTNAAGAYSFSNLGYGNYIIYPEEYSYYTTPSDIITLSAATPSATGTDFKQHTDYGTITPFDATEVSSLDNKADIVLFPNPASNTLMIQWKTLSATAAVTIADMTGRIIMNATINTGSANGLSQLNIADLRNGIYLITVKSDNIYYSNKLTIQK